MKIDIIITAIILFINWFLGGFDNSLKILTLLIIINCIVELIISFSSYKKVILSIVLKKFLLLLVVGIAHLIDIHLSSGLLLRSLTLLFYITNESKCFLLNLSYFGVCVPNKLIMILSLYTNQGKDDNHLNKN